MHAVWYRFRAEPRLRWRAWVGLAVIVGLIAGTVILLAAGSRRTSSAYGRFLEAQHAYDVALVVQCQRPSAKPGEVDVEETGPRSTSADLSCTKHVAALPAVAESLTVLEYPGYVETQDRVSLDPDTYDPCYSGRGEVSLVADPTGRLGTSFNVSHIVEGRRARPGAADEVVISKDTADARGINAGDTLRMYLFDGKDCLDNPVFWRDVQTVRVVGIGLTPGELAPPSGLYLATVNLTPPFAGEAGVVSDAQRYLLVRLREGTTINELERAARRGGYAALPVLSARQQAELMEDSTRPVAVSLALIAALVALAGVAVVGQMVIRQTYLESRDRVVLAALGLTPSRQFGLAMLRAGFVGAIGAGLAIAAAIAASPLMPVGVARDVEPSAGVHVDMLAIVLGFVGTLLFVVLVSAVPAWRLAGRAMPVRDAGRGRSRAATTATALARRGFPPVPVSGVRFALDRGSGTRAVPVWSSLVGLVVASTTLVGAITFGAGLTHLLGTPRLVGWNWDVAAPFPDDELGDDPVVAAGWIDNVTTKLRATDAVGEFATGTFWPPFPQGRSLELGQTRVETDLIGFSAGDPVGPSVIAGRAPQTSDEILLGPETLDALHRRIGDHVDAIGQAGTWDEPGAETSVRMRIVGTGIVPTSPDLGRGATMTLAGVARLNDLAVAQGVFIRRAPGVNDRELRVALGRAFGTDPELIGPRFVDPERKLSDLREINDVPSVFGALMALMAAAVLAHVLVSALGQHRRELALLRTLGFTRGQVSRTVGLQASTYALITLVVSVPLGVVLGRAIWRSYAESIGVVPEAASPWATLAAVTVAAFVIANMIAAYPARRATRVAPAAILRTE